MANDSKSNDGAAEPDATARVVALEKRTTDVEEQLLEQEHRVLPLWRNMFRYSGAPDRGGAAALEAWQRRRTAARWALFWYFLQPATVAAGGVGVVALVSLFFAYEANGLLKKQNELFLRQNDLISLQNKFFQQQTEKMSEQILSARDQTYFAQRGSLIATIFQRRSDCAAAERYCPMDRPCRQAQRVCPFSASLRERQEAVESLVALERTYQDRRPGRPDPSEFSRAVADLSYLELRGAKLRDLDLRGVDLRGADLRGSDLRGTDLSDAFLMGADLRDTALKDTNFTCANLAWADLTGAYTVWVDLKFSTLWGTRGGKALEGGMGPAGALYDEETDFPAGFDPSDFDMELGGPPGNLDDAFSLMQWNKRCEDTPADEKAKEDSAGVSAEAPTPETSAQ